MVRTLCEVTEAQLVAARRLDGAQLHELNEKRSNMIFELQVFLDSPIENQDPDRVDLASEVRRLNRAETRLRQVAGTVIETIDSISVRGPTRTYGRRGRIER